jgi:putative transposase
MLYVDRDTKFTKAFRAALTAEGFRAAQCPVLAPNMKPHVERWIQSLRHECLSAFVILGERHLNHLIREYTDCFNHRRPHSTLASRSPNTRGQPFSGDPPEPIYRLHLLGGVLNWHQRDAA